MDATAFERQVDRLALYFRKSKLTADQKSEWWLSPLGRADIEDFTRAVDAMIADGRVGSLPSLSDAVQTTARFRAARLERHRGAQQTVEDIPATPGFQQDAKRNLLRLYGPVQNERGKYLPRFTGDSVKGISATQQACINLVALAERHQVDTDLWPFLPTGDPADLRAYQRAVDHMNHPRQLAAPTAEDLARLNRRWVDTVFAPTVEKNLGGAI